MPVSITRPTSTAEAPALPVDIETMRAAARRLLVEDAEPPKPGELETLTLQLRRHINLLLPEVEQTADGLPHDDIPRYCALACVGEARMKLALEPGPGLHGGIAHARRLSRVINALCDHYQNLDGGHT